MSNTKTLTVGCGAYDRTWPLIASRTKIEGFELDWEILPPEQAFLRGMVQQEFDLAEMSFSTYMLQVSRGNNPDVAIPFPMNMVFAPKTLHGRSVTLRLSGAKKKFPSIFLITFHITKLVLRKHCGV